MKSSNKNNYESGWFSNFLKNLFFLLIIIQFLPLIFSTLSKYFKEVFHPKTEVGCLKITSFLSDSSFYVKHINKFLKDPDIKGLLLKIDCPGGYPGTPQAVFNELKKFKVKKPIIALVENICASGAYYLACASNDIIASPSALVGNIGTYMRLPNFKDFADTYKVRVNLIQSGKYKTAGDPFKKESPEDFAYLQETSNDTYKQFIKDVAESRKLDIAKQDSWANGKAFTATRGLELGLVDGFGSLSDAKELIKKRIAEYGMEAREEIKLIYPAKKSPLAMLFSGQEDDSTAVPDGIEERASNFFSSLINKIIENFSSKPIKL